MHVVLTTVRYTAGLPSERVACGECLCGWVAVTGEDDEGDLERLIADHLAFHGAA